MVRLASTFSTNFAKAHMKPLLGMFVWLLFPNLEPTTLWAIARSEERRVGKECLSQVVQTGFFKLQLLLQAIGLLGQSACQMQLAVHFHQRLILVGFPPIASLVPQVITKHG